jgi:TetR/AcrR family fatty acid metabolism transcriptional regulator
MTMAKDPEKDKRRRIVEAAGARFRHYGITKTAMQEIAQDAGVAVGTLYRYFKDKDDLLVACTDDFVARHRREADDALGDDGTPPEARLRRYVIARYRHCREVGTGSQHAADLARAVLRLRPERRREEAALMEQTIGVLLREGVRRGLLGCEDPERDTMAFLIAIAYCFPTATTSLDEWPRKEWLLLVVDWFLEVWRSRATGQVVS